MAHTTMGVYKTYSEAEMAIKELVASGIDESDISCLYTDNKGNVTDTQTGDTVSSAAAGATTGAVLGGIAGLVVANGILPGLGSLFVAGPLAAALGLTGAAATTVAGAATGAAAGGLLGALSQWGVDESDATLYQGMVEKGNVLLVAHTDHDEVSNVKEVFNRTHATEVREYSK